MTRLDGRGLRIWEKKRVRSYRLMGMSSWELHSRDGEWQFVVRDGKFRGQVFRIPDMSME